MTQNPINKMAIIIPHVGEDSPTKLSREEILRNLREITPEQLDLIAKEMRVAREKREKEEEERINSKYSGERRKFISRIENKPKNMINFRRKDSKITENWETVWIVLLYDYTRDYKNSFSDPEYWTKIFVKVGDFETEKEFVYRDAYDWTKDDWSKAYTKIRRLQIQWDTLKVWLWKEDNEPTLYQIKIPKDKQKKQNSGVDLWRSYKNEFKEHIEYEKERLLKQLTRTEKYPNVFWYGARQIPNLPIMDIPFDEAIIADEYIDMTHWEAYIVIKTQIDADSSKWKQYSWIKYKIFVNWDKFKTNDFNGSLETRLIEHFDVREEELVNGLEVKIKAKD